MVSVWVAVLGIVGTLAAAVLTQVLTNRREFQRDQLRWAQERQQRELDGQKAALLAALTALHKWHSALTAVNLYLDDPYERAAETRVLPGLATEAIDALGSVRLICSDRSINATAAALKSLDLMNYNLRMALEHFSHSGGAHESGIETDEYDQAMTHVAEVYRVELAKLAAEPVVLPRKSRKGLRLPWRKTD